MGVNYNIVIAEGLIVYNPDEVIKFIDIDDYNEENFCKYEIECDGYSSNTPIFIYDISTREHQSDISRAYTNIQFDYHEKGKYGKEKPLYCGTYPTVLPMDFYKYDNKKLQKEKLEEYYNEVNDKFYEYGKVEILDKEKFKKWSTYGKFVYVYHT